MDQLNSMINSINAFAWGLPMLGMLGVTNLLLTLGLVFMPWRKVVYGFKILSAKSDEGEGEVKPSVLAWHEVCSQMIPDLDQLRSPMPQHEPIIRLDKASSP